MDIFLSVCAAAFLLVVGVVAVFLIQTLVQVKRTARSVEILSENLNEEVLRVQNITDAASNVAHVFSGTLGKTLSLALSLLNGFRRRSQKQRSNGEKSEKEEGRRNAVA